MWDENGMAGTGKVPNYNGQPSSTTPDHEIYKETIIANRKKILNFNVIDYNNHI